MFSKLTGSAAKAKKRYLSPVARVSGVDDGDDGMLAMMGVRFFLTQSEMQWLSDKVQFSDAVYYLVPFIVCT